MNEEEIHQAFRRLNDRLVYRELRFRLVVCGGAALIVTHLVPRATADVDVLAFVAEDSADSTPALHKISDLPIELVEAAARVAHDLGLGSDWLNAGPAAELRRFGFPQGIEGRLMRRRYGDGLTVYFLNRWDQVHLKMLAAMDPKAGPRHLADLLDIEPVEDEVRSAIQWLLAQETGAEFRRKLLQVLNRIGHEKLIAVL